MRSSRQFNESQGRTMFGTWFLDDKLIEINSLNGANGLRWTGRMDHVSIRNLDSHWRITQRASSGAPSQRNREYGEYLTAADSRSWCRDTCMPHCPPSSSHLIRLVLFLGLVFCILTLLIMRRITNYFEGIHWFLISPLLTRRHRHRMAVKKCV